MTNHMATGTPVRRAGYCGVCGKRLQPEQRHADGHWPRTCGPECTREAQSSAQHRATAARRAAKLARVAKLEAERIQSGVGAPRCKVCDRGITPMFTTDGYLRSICSKTCNAILRADATRRLKDPSGRTSKREREARKSVTARSVYVYQDPNHRPKRVCDVCCDLSHRRPRAGCLACGLPFAEETVVAVKIEMSPLALAPRWA